MIRFHSMVRTTLGVTTIALALSWGFGCATDSEDEPAPDTSADTAAPVEVEQAAELAKAMCAKLSTLECVAGDMGVTPDELREGCLKEYEQQAAGWEAGGCTLIEVATLVKCMTEVLRCPADRVGERVPAEDLMAPLLTACIDGLAANSTCLQDMTGTSAIQCVQVPTTPGELRVDTNGDGSMEVLPADVVDRRVACTYDETQPHLVIEVPPVLVPAGAETFTCVFGTWDGPDMAIVGSSYGTDPISDHHVLVNALPDYETVEVPDGVAVDCDSVAHSPGSPLFHGLANPDQTLGSKLKTGQRFYVERHSLNASLEPILVNATYHMTLAPIDSLVTLASWYILGPAHIQIPPGTYHIKSSCTWPEDTSVLVVAPHMHENGVRFATDWTSEAGTKRIIDIDPWLEEYVNTDILQYTFEVGEFTVKKGDVFTTHCTWFNPTEEDILEPREMCNTYGAALLAEPFMCTSEAIRVTP